MAKLKSQKEPKWRSTADSINVLDSLKWYKMTKSLLFQIKKQQKCSLLARLAPLLLRWLEWRARRFAVQNQLTQNLNAARKDGQELEDGKIRSRWRWRDEERWLKAGTISIRAVHFHWKKRVISFHRNKQPARRSFLCLGFRLESVDAWSLNPASKLKVLT